MTFPNPSARVTLALFLYDFVFSVVYVTLILVIRSLIWRQKTLKNPY